MWRMKRIKDIKCTSVAYKFILIIWYETCVDIKSRSNEKKIQFFTFGAPIDQSQVDNNHNHIRWSDHMLHKIKSNSNAIRFSFRSIEQFEMSRKISSRVFFQRFCFVFCVSHDCCQLICIFQLRNQLLTWISLSFSGFSVWFSEQYDFSF